MFFECLREGRQKYIALNEGLFVSSDKQQVIHPTWLVGILRKDQQEGLPNPEVLYSVSARSPLSLPQSPFSRSLRSTICDPGHLHPMRTLRITNGGPERAKKKRSLGEREGGEIVQTQNLGFAHLSKST